MTTPIAPGNSSWYHPCDEELDKPPVHQNTTEFCKNPEGVIEGLLCGDQTAISDACRRAKPGSIDNYLCDDKNLKQAQDTAWGIAKKAFFKAVELIVGGKVSQ